MCLDVRGVMLDLTQLPETICDVTRQRYSTPDHDRLTACYKADSKHAEQAVQNHVGAFDTVQQQKLSLRIACFKQECMQSLLHALRCILYINLYTVPVSMFD